SSSRENGRGNAAHGSHPCCHEGNHWCGNSHYSCDVGRIYPRGIPFGPCRNILQAVFAYSGHSYRDFRHQCINPYSCTLCFIFKTKCTCRKYQRSIDNILPEVSYAIWKGRKRLCITDRKNCLLQTGYPYSVCSFRNGGLDHRKSFTGRIYPYRRPGNDLCKRYYSTRFYCGKNRESADTD